MWDNCLTSGWMQVSGPSVWIYLTYYFMYFRILWRYWLSMWFFDYLFIGARSGLLCTNRSTENQRQHLTENIVQFFILWQLVGWCYKLCDKTTPYLGILKTEWWKTWSSYGMSYQLFIYIYSSSWKTLIISLT